MLSSTFKESSVAYQLVSCLEPLNASQIDEYSRFILNGNGIDQGMVENFTQAVLYFPQCHGRGRFVAFLLDSFLQDPTHDVHLAISKFVMGLTNVNSHVFPMRFYREDQRMGLNRVAGNDTLNRIFCEGLIQYMMNGVASLNLTNGDVSDAIHVVLDFVR